MLRHGQHGLGAGGGARSAASGWTRCAQSQRGAYETYIRLTVKTDQQERSVAGTVFSDGKPRIIQIKGIDMEAEFGRHMLYVTNEDKPGFIGALGMLLGDAGVNIATFNLGRKARAARRSASCRSTSRCPPPCWKRCRACRR